MKNNLSRRSFVKQSALAAGVFATAPFNILHAANAGDKVRFVQIGGGGRAMSHLAAAVNEHLVGLVEVDDNRPAVIKKWKSSAKVMIDISVTIHALCRKRATWTGSPPLVRTPLLGPS